MAQNRPPPSFQEYANNWLANRHYRLATLAERGLLQTMRYECWVNHSLPSDPATLARVIGFTSEEVSRALPAVMPFFAETAEGQIISPELEDYRAHLAGIRVKQSDGGKNGAAKTNGKKKSSETIADKGFQGDSGNPAGKSRVEPRVSSTVQSSTVQSSQTQSLKKGIVLVDDPFVSAYEQTESSYEKASNGY